MEKLKCPYVPAGKILVSKKWAKNPLGRELICKWRYYLTFYFHDMKCAAIII